MNTTTHITQTIGELAPSQDSATPNQLIRLGISLPNGEYLLRVARTQTEVPVLLAPYLTHECEFSIRHLRMPLDPRRISLFCRPGYEIEVWLDGEWLANAHRKEPGQTLEAARAETPTATFFALPAGCHMYAVGGNVVDTAEEAFVLTYNGPASPDADILRAFGFVELR